jgi:8-oxo-dGTP pyrophosphatase MutT (NUDIX family)
VTAAAPRLARDLLETLRGWTPLDPDQRALADEYRAFVAERGAAAVDRDLGRAHLTASAFVLTPDLRQVLLCFHRKGGFWVQLGGHVELTDPSLAAAARREATEEGGIADLRPLGSAPLDVDRHDLGAGFARCDTHWDVGYGFVTDRAHAPVVSTESEAVAWWPVDALPSEVPPGFARRLHRAVRMAAAR